MVPERAHIVSVYTAAGTAGYVAATQPACRATNLTDTIFSPEKHVNHNIGARGNCGRVDITLTAFRPY
jgi:hypothetical protein